MPVFIAMLKTGGESSPPLEAISRLYQYLCRITTVALNAFADEVANDPTTPKNLPPSATVHVVTSNTIRYVHVRRKEASSFVRKRGRQLRKVMFI